MRIPYYILSEKAMYSTAIKLMLDEQKKACKIYQTASEVKKDLLNPRGSIVIIGPNSVYDPYELCQEVSRMFPMTAVLLFLDNEDIDYKKAMFTGAVDVVDIESDEFEIIQALEKAEQVIQLKVKSELGDKKQDRKAKVITVCSTKGGVGKTTISVNTAVALNKHNLKVAIIDLDLQFGDVALMFDVEPNQTIYDWAKQSYENGDKSYEGFITKHQTGLDIIAAPVQPEFAELVTGEHVAYLIGAMKDHYDMIIIDTPPAFVETSLVALEQSDQILLVASMDLPALKNGKLAIETLSLLGLKEKIKIILNRDSEMEGISKSHVEEVLGMRIEGCIPSDYRTVISSINKGLPFVNLVPRAPVAKSVMKIGEDIIKVFPKSQKQKNNLQEKRRLGTFFSFKK